MKKPYEYLDAIYHQQAIHWNNFVRTMSQHQVSPTVIYQVFKPELHDALVTLVHIQNPESFAHLQQRFAPPIPVTNRVNAALAGNSHQTPVEGSLIVLQAYELEKSFVAVSRNGLHWAPLPTAQQHLVLVENMQNFLQSQQTFRFLSQSCRFSAPPSATLLAYGAGNAAAKACHAHYYQHFSSISCLFDIDLGGLEIYVSIKKMLLPYALKPHFLAPADLTQRLQRSRWFLNERERSGLYQLSQKPPELQPVITRMLKTQKKLEQESYLET